MRLRLVPRAPHRGPAHPRPAPGADTSSPPARREGTHRALPCPCTTPGHRPYPRPRHADSAAPAPRASPAVNGRSSRAPTVATGAGALLPPAVSCAQRPLNRPGGAEETGKPSASSAQEKLASARAAGKSHSPAPARRLRLRRRSAELLAPAGATAGRTGGQRQGLAPPATAWRRPRPMRRRSAVTPTNRMAERTVRAPAPSSPPMGGAGALRGRGRAGRGGGGRRSVRAPRGEAGGCRRVPLP